MHPEQLFRRPAEPVRCGAMLLDEGEGVGLDASPFRALLLLLHLLRLAEWSAKL
jgi:hypothetical protein